MFDLKMLFQTTVHVKPVDKSFEEILNLCSGKANLPYSVHTVDHTMTMTDTPVIPDDTWIENARKIIFDQMVKSFSNQKNLNAEVIKTEFVCLKEVKQKP